MTVRVAYLCGEYPRVTDTFVQREIAGLRQEGLFVETISVRRPASGERGTGEQEEERRNTHYLLPCSPWRVAGAHVSLLLRSPLRYVRGLLLAFTVRAPGMKSFVYQLFYFAEAGLVAALMRRLEIGHIHNHTPNGSGYVAMLAALLGKFTYSMTLHGHGIFSEPARWNLREKIERALFVICVSHHARSQAMLHSNRRHWEKLYLVRCGVPAEGLPVRAHNGGGHNVLFIGRLDHVKGLPLLIDAFSILTERYNDAHLDIVGDGPERDDLESIVEQKQLKEHVTFHGYQSQQRVREHLARADVFAMSSFVEGIPVVLMEAMAQAVPVVAPAITGIPELVRDGVTGLLATPGNPRSLAERIQLLFDDEGLRARLSRAARRLVEREFNLDAEVRTLAGIMAQELSKARHCTEIVGNSGGWFRPSPARIARHTYENSRPSN